MTELSLTFLLVFVAASPSQAQASITAVSNRAEPLAAEFNVSNFAFAASFTTASGAYTWDSVTVSAFSNSGGSSALRLRTDASGLPGVLVEDLGPKTIGAGSQAVTYTSTGTLLQADTTYWLTLGEAGSGDFQWDVTTSTAETSPVSWTIGDQAGFSNNGGATWQQFSFGPPNESPQFAIQATPVPEPGTSLLLGIGLAGFLGVRHLRKKRT